MAIPYFRSLQGKPVTTVDTPHTLGGSGPGEKTVKAVSGNSQMPPGHGQTPPLNTAPAHDLHDLNSSAIKAVPTNPMLLGSTSQWKSIIEPMLNHAEIKYFNSNLTAYEKEQLVWVQNNPQYSPSSKAAQPNRPHPDIFRTTNRLHCLQLLRTGKKNDYLTFILSQQNNKHSEFENILNQASFEKLSLLFQGLSEMQYQALRVATIISHVVLTPDAKNNIASHMNIKEEEIPSDSTKCLSLIAPVAEHIYPLAETLRKKFEKSEASPNALEWLHTAFMPDSHLRHWIHNEGGQHMYSHITSVLQNKTLSSEQLNFWIMFWVINSAGLKASDISKGSKYLTEDIYQCIRIHREIMTNHGADPNANHMALYLQKRVALLGLEEALPPDDIIAFGHLAAKFIVINKKRAQELKTAFDSLAPKIKKEWQEYTDYQLQNISIPSPTYTPAWFEKIVDKKGLGPAIAIILPIFIRIVNAEKEIRNCGDHPLSNETPVSYMLIAQEKAVKTLLDNSEIGNTVKSIDINNITGVVTLIYRQDTPAQTTADNTDQSKRR